MPTRLLLAPVLLLAALPARADIWLKEDGQGVLHFTNIEPAARGWRKVYRSGPGKAMSVSGAVGGCKESRADVVPSRDRSPERFARYDRDIHEAATLYQLPEALIRAVIKIESDYDPRVVSCAGARGLMQIMPSVEKDMGIGNVWDPRQNILGGSRLLRKLANRFQGDLTLTIAGYHAGAGAVEKYHGVPPYETTHQYLTLVRRQYDRFRAQYGASPPPVAAASAPAETALQ